MRVGGPIAAVLLMACTGGEDKPPADAGTDGAPVPCSEPVSERDPGSICVLRVTGKVTDIDGKPLPPTKDPDGKDLYLLLTVCGVYRDGFTCLGVGNATADGTYDVTLGKWIDIARFVLIAHARPDHATLYVALPAPNASGVVNIADTLRLPQLPTGPALVAADGKPAADAVTAAPITLTFPTGAFIERDLDDIAYDTDPDTKMRAKGNTLRVAPVPLTNAPPFAKDQNLLGLWALSPFDAKFDDGKTPATPKKVAVALANPDTTKMPKGAKVELVAMGEEIDGSKPFNGGRPQVVAKAVVSADGSKIETEPGEGITFMTWLGVRPAGP